MNTYTDIWKFINKYNENYKTHICHYTPLQRTMKLTLPQDAEIIDIDLNDSDSDSDCSSSVVCLK